MTLRETVQSHSSKTINGMTTAHYIDLPAALAERLTTCHSLARAARHVHPHPHGRRG